MVLGSDPILGRSVGCPRADRTARATQTGHGNRADGSGAVAARRELCRRTVDQLKVLPRRLWRSTGSRCRASVYPSVAGRGTAEKPLDGDQLDVGVCDAAGRGQLRAG